MKHSHACQSVEADAVLLKYSVHNRTTAKRLLMAGFSLTQIAIHLLYFSHPFPKKWKDSFKCIKDNGCT